MSFVIGILTFILIITSLFLVMVVLMQRAKTDGGIGSAMGGGSMESTFGAETGNVLSGATIKAAIVFFVVSFTLYLSHIYQSKHHDAADSRLPTVNVPASPAKGPAPLTTGALPLAVPSSSPAPQPATSQPVEPKKP
jgi:preprotein translocase subunit SecG